MYLALANVYRQNKLMTNEITIYEEVIMAAGTIKSNTVDAQDAISELTGVQVSNFQTIEIGESNKEEEGPDLMDDGSRRKERGEENRERAN